MEESPHTKREFVVQVLGNQFFLLNLQSEGPSVAVSETTEAFMSYMVTLVECQANQIKSLCFQEEDEPEN